MGKNGSWEKEGYFLKIEENNDGFFTVISFDQNDSIVGKAVFKLAAESVGWSGILPSPDFLEVCTVQVEEDHRRKGLATRMYDLIEEYTGRKILNGIGTISQSEDAKKFWTSRKG